MIAAQLLSVYTLRVHAAAVVLFAGVNIGSIIVAHTSAADVGSGVQD